MLRLKPDQFPRSVDADQRICPLQRALALADFRKEHLDEICRAGTPQTSLLEQTMASVFDESASSSLLMYDQVAVASAIDPTLVNKVELYVDVDIYRGVNYGVSVGGEQIWPGAEGARKMWVQYDLDWDRFITLFIERLGRPPQR